MIGTKVVIAMAATLVLFAPVVAWAQATSAPAAAPAATDTKVAPAADAAKEYTIKLHRPSKVGEVTEGIVSGTIKESVTVSAEGKVINKKETVIEYKLEGKDETLAVDDKGRATKFSFTVTKFVQIKDGQEVKIVAPGKVILGERIAKEEVFQFKDSQEPLSAEAIKILKHGGPSVSSGGPTDDEIMGSDKPRKVGDSWDINSELAAKDMLQSFGMAVAKEDIKGQMRIAGAARTNGVDCLDIRMDLALSPFPLPPGLPDGAKVLSGKLTASSSQLLPVDVTLPVLTAEKTMTGKVSVLVPAKEPGKEMTVTSVQESSAKSSMSPKKSEKK